MAGIGLAGGGGHAPARVGAANLLGGAAPQAGQGQTSRCKLLPTDVVSTRLLFTTRNANRKQTSLFSNLFLGAT